MANGLLNPTLNLGIGLLSQPTLGGGLLQGQQLNMQAIQMQQQREQAEMMNALRQAQMQQLQRQQRLQNQLGQAIEQPSNAPLGGVEGPLTPQDQSQRQMTEIAGLLGRMGDTSGAIGLLSPSSQESATILSAKQLRDMGFDIQGGGSFEVKFAGNQIVDINSLGGKGDSEMTVDPFGNILVLDKPSGVVTILGKSFQAGDVPTPTGEGLKLEQETTVGTGPQAKLQRGLNAFIGPFMQGIPFRETAEAKNNIGLFNQEAKQGLVNNPKFPWAEQQFIADLLPNTKTFFTDPDSERDKLVRLRNFLTTKREFNIRSINSGGITVDEVGRLTSQNNSINRILEIMGPSNEAIYDPTTGTFR